MMTADEMLLKGYSFEKMRLYFYMMKEAGVAKAEPEFYHREYNRMRYLAIKKNKKKWNVIQKRAGKWLELILDNCEIAAKAA